MIETIIYVLGVVPAYIMQKKAFMVYSDGEWTRISRGFGIVCGLLSWLGFAVSLIQWLIMRFITSEGADKKASW